jgi:hypothetical protein
VRRRGYFATLLGGAGRPSGGRSALRPPERLRAHEPVVGERLEPAVGWRPPPAAPAHAPEQRAPVESVTSVQRALERGEPREAAESVPDEQPPAATERGHESLVFPKAPSERAPVVPTHPRPLLRPRTMPEPHHVAADGLPTALSPRPARRLVPHQPELHIGAIEVTVLPPQPPPAQPPTVPVRSRPRPRPLHTPERPARWYGLAQT